MTSRPAVDVPYERQEGRNWCGAAALAMVLRSLGRPATQAGLWPLVSTVGPDGGDWSCAGRMARHARARGLDVAALAAPDLRRSLRAWLAAGLRVILNRRTSLGGDTWHFVVPVAARGPWVVLHDPGSAGPAARHLAAELEALMDGNPALVLGTPGGRAAPCPVCGLRPARHGPACPRCGAAGGPEPPAALGCDRPLCPGRLFDFVYCLNCATGLVAGPLATERTAV